KDLSIWMARGEDLFLNLLFAISNDVRFAFDRVQLRKGAYSPIAHGNLELEQATVLLFQHFHFSVFPTFQSAHFCSLLSTLLSAFLSVNFADPEQSEGLISVSTNYSTHLTHAASRVF